MTPSLLFHAGPAFLQLASHHHREHLASYVTIRRTHSSLGPVLRLDEHHDEETTEDAVSEESDKREVVYRRTLETYSRTAPITASPTTTTTQHHYHRHHHHHNSNHGSVLATSPPPPPPPPARTTPTSPAHAVTPPVVGVRASPGTLGVNAVQSHQQQTSPRTSLSYPGSPASSPPRVVLPPRGSSSPLGLLSALSQDSSSPPMGGTSSDPGLSRLPHESLHSHLNNGIRHNGITKSLSLSPPSHNFTHHGVYSPEDNSFKEDKKRSGSTPSREVHNKLEKNRRAHLKECFETLRRQLPSMDDKKISNQTILKAAHRHIQNLKRKEREYEHEMERLAREKIAHQQKLSALKKELSARWDHIDFNTLLPDMASLEQHRDKETKSTTTASEQPDLDDDAPRLDASNGQVSSAAVVASCPLSPRLSTNQPQGTSFTTIASSGNSIGATGLATLREHFTDSNQPLNLSTSIVDTAKVSPSGQTLVTQSVSLHQNGEWGTRQASPHYTQAQYHASTNKEEETWSATVVTSVTPTATGDTATTVHSEQHLPIVGSTGGINLSAQLVAGGMQLNGAPGGLLGQPAIQVITPEGYKLLPADHAPNGAKPLTITLAHPVSLTAEGLERADSADEVKSSPGAMMLALNKNGVSALHLAVPTPPRSLPHSQGTNGTVTTVPLNLSVGGTATVKVTSAATSLIPSYIPITHANGITQLVPGLGTSVGTLVSGIGTPLVAPLVVSQPQRPVVPGSATTAGNKGLKATAVAGSTNSMPLVTAQYASSLAGGLVKPVVVVSAPTAVAGMVTGAPAGASGKP
ncbi:TSC22 domain family protein 1-like isoform X3 [Macrobrachium nipponense]|uniref:TSC22 domain family protein 1-like isoform X3 n=1 Tax=Macrobrachium nipponense TaxID=159736 RepID=UPI0030C89EAC